MVRTERITQQEWRDAAACRGADIDIFFPQSEDDAGAAKAICATCPVREPCLEFALAVRQLEGVWGGLTDTERRRLRRRRQAQARATRAA